jgi:uncharacterized metal-binding protein
MPNGKTHDIITFVAAPVVAGATYWLTKDIKTSAIILICYLFASFMFNGDLDMNSKPYNRWWLFKMIWIPYQLMFHHRSVFTHGLVIGTVIRVLYISIIPLIIFSCKGQLHVVKAINWHLAVLIFIGLEAGAAIHTIADYTIKN